MSVAVVTAAWKRPEVFRAFLRHVTRIIPPSEVFCAGSPDDGCDTIANKFGIVYERVPNEMGAKWNHATMMSRDSEATHRLFLGSDDFMDDRLWSFADQYTAEHFGLRDCLIYHKETGRAVHWRGYIGKREGEPVGAGKIIAASVLDRLHWQPFVAGRTRTLDNDMQRKMLELGVTVEVRHMREVGLLVDVKTGDNLTSWNRLRSDRPSKTIPPGWWEANAPDLLNDIRS